MKIEILSEKLNPYECLQVYEKTLIAQGKWGAVSTFVGTMRDYNEGDTVQSMFLEHYQGMTEKYLYTISEMAKQRWDILDTLIIHRIGEVQPGDTIVLVAAWAGHRAPAFEACRFLIEELKSRAPFWKKETLNNGVRWVENCSSKVLCN
ncbi:molybdenum cofactor biosynthesis protein MoaE [Candidatus Parabeggiatoa sp. HSG14]|uniref:molybdenum cofactor biosynthesis protein MoaE n=1 Tax=Candidatus Parabeggiatoa sp. HSG14 TaxID=3055593 RepID=UPI0025A80BC1|nr:molybdenum cofactor biosynthesis protein MoaE [Thiotrichales bacterium HSG14]